jgi:glycosyltransferase involved in cell wall biosynthesis
MIANETNVAESFRPKVTVVVPVRNAELTIGLCLQAICKQLWEGNELEVIVVDNGSTDRTLQKIADEFPSVRLLQESKPGVSHARNLAIQEARGDWIAFTDADCVPTPTWIQALVRRAAESQEASFVGGSIRALLPTTSIGLFSENLFDQGHSIERENPPSFISANLFVRKADLVRVGMFNPKYPRGQDTELAWRSHFQFGARFAYAKDAVVEHANVSTWIGLIRKAWQHGSGASRLIDEYQRELKVDPRKRCKATKSYKEFFKSATVLIGYPVFYRKQFTWAEVRNRFYFAVFRMVRHLSFVFHTYRRSSTQQER